MIRTGQKQSVVTQRLPKHVIKGDVSTCGYVIAYMTSIIIIIIIIIVIIIIIIIIVIILLLLVVLLLLLLLSTAFKSTDNREHT